MWIVGVKRHESRGNQHRCQKRVISSQSVGVNYQPVHESSGTQVAGVERQGVVSNSGHQ